MGLTAEKYSSEPFGSAFIVLLPSVQLAGHTSPCFSCGHSERADNTGDTGGTYDELEGLDEADRLVDGAADGEVVDRDLAEDALGVDDEEPAERDAVRLDEHAVVARDLHVAVRDERQLEVGAEAALAARLGRPGKVRVGRVRRDACQQVSAPTREWAVRATHRGRRC